MSRNITAGTVENAIIAAGDVNVYQHEHNQSRSENLDQLGKSLFGLSRVSVSLRGMMYIHVYSKTSRVVITVKTIPRSSG